MSHGFLPRPQQGLQSLSGRLPSSLAPDSGTMQHVPDDVLQELQQQGAGEEEARDRGARPSREPHRRDGRHGEAVEASLPLPSPDLPPSPSPTPLGSHASRHARYSRPSIPRRRSGRYSDARGVAQAPLPLPLRSDARPRPAATPRSPAQVPPQFVGGRVETDAHLLEPSRETEGATTAESTSEGLSIPKNESGDYFPAFNPDAPMSPSLSHHASFCRNPGSTNRPPFARTPGSTGRISFPRFTGSSSNHSSPRSTDSAGRLSFSRTPGLTGRPSFSRSPASVGCFPFPRSAGPIQPTPSPSPSLPSSSESNASSFAYFARDRRGDRTLLKKKNRPLQHRVKTPPVVQAPLPIHSPSYYIPKIVEESAITKKTSQIPPPLSARSPGPHPKTSDSTTRGQAQLCQSESISSLGLRFSTSKPRSGGTDADSNPRTPGSPGPFAFSGSELKSAGQELSLPPTVIKLKLPFHHRTPREFDHVSAEDLRTPPEKEPTSPMDRPLSHGHHHFQTFGPDLIPAKLDEEQQPQQVEHPPVKTQMPETPGYFPMASNAVDDRATCLKTVHKRSSLFNVFRSPHIDSIQEESDGEGGRSNSNKRSVFPMGHTAAAVTHYLPTRALKRRSSTSSRSNTTPTELLGPPTSKWPPTSTPLSTHWEFLVSESKQPSGHVREQTPLSPLTAPQDWVRPKLTREPNFVDVDKAVRQINPKVVDFAPVDQDAPDPPSRSLQAKKRVSTIQISVPSPPSFLPSEMKRVNTPPQAPELSSANAGGFKGFFFDMRSIPPEPKTPASDDTTSHPQPHRFRKLLHVKSVQHLLPKLSIPSLKRKHSHNPDKRSTKQRPNDPLTVTNFSQTPFSQRLGDTRRNKLHRVRQYLRDTSSTSGGARGEYSSTDDEALMLGTFELDVPDHLPNSPLCPLSPKHRGGGAAICPLHGRRRTVGPSVAAAASLAGAGSGLVNGRVQMGPRIVFDSGVQQADEGWKGS